jgi:hypothetical protein
MAAKRLRKRGRFLLSIRSACVYGRDQRSPSHASDQDDGAPRRSFVHDLVVTSCLPFVKCGLGVKESCGLTMARRHDSHFVHFAR